MGACVTLGLRLLHVPLPGPTQADVPLTSVGQLGTGTVTQGSVFKGCPSTPESPPPAIFYGESAQIR